jgi:outer membrane receptor protein involved in Fe transport
MKRILILSIIIFFCYSNKLFSQKAVLQGVVTDEKTKETLIGVNIIVSKELGVVTDENGRYRIEVPAGTHSITFRYVGYTEEVKIFRFLEGELKTLNIAMARELRMLDAVVVSAGRHEQKLSDVTVSMEIIKPSMIESNNITSLEGAIQKIPGVFIMDGQASIRGGSGYTYGAGSRTLLLVDDLPMLTGASGEARWDFAPLENMEQVEIIKGASSALYGSSALNGVINIRTRYPGIEPSTSITMFSGIYGNPRREEIKWWKSHSPFFTGARFGHAQQINNFDVVLGGNIQSEKGYQENHNEQRIRFNFNLRYRFKRIEGLTMGINTNYMDRTGDVFLLWLDGDSGVWRANPTYQQSFHNTSLNIYPFITYYNKHNSRHSLKMRFYSINNMNDTDQDSFDDTYYTEYQYQKKFKNTLTLSNGTSFLYNESRSQIFGDTKHFGSNVSLFSQVDHKFFSRLNTSFGVRLEGYRIDEEELKFKPVLRTGLNYIINESTFARASFGMGYRYPTIAEKFTASGAGSIKIFPNPDLRDETGWSSEIALKKGFRVSGWNGYADLAFFWTEYHNMIEFMFGYHNPDSVQLIVDLQNPDNPNHFMHWIGFRAENINNARITGLDFTITGEGKFFGLPARLLAGYTYTNPIDMDAHKTDSLRSTKKNILKYRFYHNVKFDFEVSYKKLTFGLNSEYCSHIINIDKAFEDTLRFWIGNVPIFNPETNEYMFLLPGLKDYRNRNNKGFLVFDLRLGWNVSDKVRFTASAKNIFNKEYMIRPADVQPPRTYVVQLTVRL